MDNYVAKCRTIEGAQALVKYMQSQFPPIPSQNTAGLGFMTVIRSNGNIEVYCEKEVNDIARDLFKKMLNDFCEMKRRSIGVERRPPQSVSSIRQVAAPRQQLRVAA